MQLFRLAYTQFPNDPREWVLEPLELQQINLIVGRNASGKSRALNVTNALANFLSGRSTALPFSGEFDVLFRREREQWRYILKYEDTLVVRESLTREGELLLDRQDNGEGRIFSEELKTMMRFQTPQTAVAAFARQDAIQHGFLKYLKEWSDGVFYYPFGKDLGQGALTVIVPGAPPVNAHDPAQTSGVFRAGIKEFGDAYSSEIVADMRAVGYRINTIDLIDPTTVQVAGPVSVQYLAVQEENLKGLTEQIDMSQGMFRALSILIHLNYGLFSKKAGCVIIDDIGEGLDFARSDALIKTVVHKAEQTKMQLIMSSNDRFVMNSVPLHYWTVLDREGPVVHVFNESNSREKFESFKFTGLNNFDFLATDFIHSQEERL
jgi:energy-coupling factor transporter ATP-binding protein EcfA2